MLTRKQWLLPMISGLILSGCESSEHLVPSERFTKTIKPIFDEYCIECHQGWMAEAALKLDSLENMREGGRSGPGIVPGDPDKGTIMASIVPSQEGPPTMPPASSTMSAREVELIREWIRQGAN